MVLLNQLTVLSFSLLLSFTSTATAGNVQKSGLSLPPSAGVNRDTVKQIFTKSYQAYKESAFGHDDLAPLSKSFLDGRNGWGASIVDALSTMAIMGLNAELKEAVDFASNIDFSRSQTPDTVSVFETTIRYLGGLLSAYELTGRQNSGLVEKAKQVADKMAFAWVGKSDIPYGRMNFTSNQPVVATSNIAEAGTLTLEWTTLSKYTGNDTYRQLAEKAVRRIHSEPAPLPGLPAQGIDPTTGTPVGGYVTWGGGSDSYFEYLIKYARLNNTNDNLYADAWREAVDSSIKTLFQTSTIGNHPYLADYDAAAIDKLRRVGSHLACFHGGNWLLGGRLLNNDTIVRYGLQLVDGCWETYAATATGIGPEAFAYSLPANPSIDDKAFFEKNGFVITNAAYILRPEVLESNFYAWRVTGDPKYLDRAASAIQSINTYLTTPDNSAYAGINNVNDRGSPKIDDMESFWFAEVLKYLYLTFDDPGHISLDNYVFNTEAHPFILPSPKKLYGSGGPTPTTPQEPFQLNPGPLPTPSFNPFIPQLLNSIFRFI